jgi:hypothetical protein
MSIAKPSSGGNESASTARLDSGELIRVEKTWLI